MDIDTLSRLRAGKLAGIRRLDLSCGLTEFPREIFDLAESLEILNLSGNQLRSLPQDLHRLNKLQAIFCSDNCFTELPVALGACTQLDMIGFKANQIETVSPQALPPQLRWLILTDNRISALPQELGCRPRLQKLMLAGNRLTVLPSSLAGSAQLELLRLAANSFDRLPAGLTELPRLAWLAYGANPMTAGREALASERQLHPYDWANLQLETVLGEGASGVIHRALHSPRPGETRPVAVKVFKGAVTSDGLPASELAACMAAGLHGSLIGAQGRLRGHPGQRPGLVMPLVAPAYRILAGPPSLASCTRDVYDPLTQFTEPQARKLALDVASAVSHLHRLGILHGDLYAHNILWDPEQGALLGDFGAATFFDQSDRIQAAKLQRQESRAMGCLLEEIIERCPTDDEGGFMRRMTDLRNRCMATNRMDRPDFDEIVEELSA